MPIFLQHVAIRMLQLDYDDSSGLGWVNSKIICTTLLKMRRKQYVVYVLIAKLLAPHNYVYHRAQHRPVLTSITYPMATSLSHAHVLVSVPLPSLCSYPIVCVCSVLDQWVNVYAVVSVVLNSRRLLLCASLPPCFYSLCSVCLGFPGLTFDCFCVSVNMNHSS